MFKKLSGFGGVFLRLAIGAGFLSAVADRFGYWGSAKEKGVAWGNFEKFTAYAGQLNWFMPEALIPLLAWTATLAEIIFGIMLILGLYTRFASLASGFLLLSFAVTMTLALGIKVPLDYSVYAASAGAFLLAGVSSYAMSVDSLLLKNHHQAKRKLERAV
jgi:uncharacterized membrane protein YphA (DoxX/SURF4 family)